MSAKTASLSASDRKLLDAALEAGLTLEKSLLPVNEVSFRSALVACAQAQSPLLRKIAELAPKVSIALGSKHLMGLLVPIERLAGRSARDEEFLYTEVDDAALAPVHDGDVLPTAKTSARVVLCENIRSAFNVGAIFRTIETFGGREVWLSGYTPDPLKTAMGADALVPSKRFDRASDAIAEAKRQGYSVVALENAPGATAIEDFEWPDKTVLVLGNERFGVDSQTLEASDHIVRISTLGRKNSLNVGIAFGVAASTWHRRTSPAAESGRTVKDSSRSHGETISAIGIVESGYADTQVAPRQGAYVEGEKPTAVIRLSNRFEGRPSNFEQALKDLNGFERAWIIFGFHESQGWLPQVRPPRGDGSKRGLFATRSPHRPNRLGISCVKIEAIDEAGLELRISEHDLLSGTPVYDIKPYIPEADSFPKALAGWVDEIGASAYELHETKNVAAKLAWLEANGETRLRPFVDEQLRFQPFDTDRKRIEKSGSGDKAEIGEHHTIAFRTWRIDYTVQPNLDGPGTQGAGRIQMLDLRSSYSSADLEVADDKYLDKTLHRLFQKEFK